MSKAQHTPGPWAIDEEMDCYTGGYHIRTDDGYAICGLWDQYTSLTEDAQKANSRLIAAAPELLEALEKALHALEHSRPINQDSVVPHNEHCAAIDAASDAIAKAKGE